MKSKYILSLLSSIFVVVGCHEVEVPLDTCGNGTLEYGEQCDDGNKDDGDGCSPTCQVEDKYECLNDGTPCHFLCGNGQLNPNEECDDGNPNDGDGCSKDCTLETDFECLNPGVDCTHLCGNGKLELNEYCDDGNKEDGDGCSKECMLEGDFECLIPGVNCTHLCGNGRLERYEQCDDKNNVDGDGCSKDCKLEATFECIKPGEPCTLLCGNGKLEPPEQCDDGNTKNDDGCSSTCTLEANFECLTPGIDCTYLCGNGQLELDEECDDGNKDDADGCSNDCKLKEGYECRKPGQICTLICGNSKLDPNEECDDGNKDDTDGCSNDCKLKEGYECPTPGENCNPLCGNSKLDPNEECDLGKETNGTEGVGCNNECKFNEGWYFNETENTVIKIKCGNGYKEEGEQCDLGNEVNGTENVGCNTNCEFNEGWYFNDTENKLIKIECGNGYKEEGEQCDEGRYNKDNAEHFACNTQCQINENWYFNDTENRIIKIECGNGYPEEGEECDDGINTLNDGCSPLCKSTPILKKSEGCALGYLAKNDYCNENDAESPNKCEETCEHDGYTNHSNCETSNDIYLPVIIRDFRNQNDGNGTDNTEGTISEATHTKIDPEKNVCSFSESFLKEFTSTSCNANSTVSETLNEDEKPTHENVGDCYSCQDSIRLWFTDNELNHKYLHKLYNTPKGHKDGIKYKSNEDKHANKMIYQESDIDFDFITKDNIGEYFDTSIIENHAVDVKCPYLGNEKKNCIYLLNQKEQVQKLLKNDSFKDDKFYPLGNLKFNNAITCNENKLTLNDFLPYHLQTQNNQFTVEAKGYFKYEPKADGKVTMQFNSDDSMWVYINYKIAVDMGGAHGAEDPDRKLELTSVEMQGSDGKTYRYNEQFNLVEGGYYPIHIFFTERGGGSVFNVDTPMIYTLTECVKDPNYKAPETDTDNTATPDDQGSTPEE